MSVLELSDLMRTNSTEKGKFMFAVDLVASCGRSVIRMHRVGCLSKVRAGLATG